MKSPFAVVLGLDGATPLGIIRSLGYENIPIIGMGFEENASLSQYSKYLDQSADLVKDENKLIEKLIDFGKNKNSKGVLFPSGDKYILFCSKYYEDLKDYYHVPETKHGKLETLLDKNINNSFGKEAGFKVPWSEYLSNFNSLVNGPIIIKPINSVGTSKRDMAVYSDSKKLLKNKKDLIKKFGNMVVQEYIPGDHRGLVEVHAYNSSKGVVISGMQRNMFSRFMNDGVFGGVVFESMFDEKLIKPSINLMKNIKFNGPVDINLKQSSLNGEYYFMEFNPRSSSNTSLDTYAGLNLPAIVYNDLTGQDFEILLKKDLRTGVKWLWEYSVQGYLDQGSSKKELINFLKEQKVIRAFYIQNDPEPYFKGNFGNEIKSIIQEIK
jgi:predicted ATP-grasp superfamily ATP-dependent carboligase